MNELQILEHNEVRVMTTEQLADAYGCESRNISDNFKNNEGRFLEGKHYFRLEGTELKSFKRYSENIGLPVNKFSPVIYLWTKRGAARHSKMLGTDRAWDVFDELEENYFNPTKNLTPAEYLLYQAKRMVENERAIRAANARLDSVDDRLQKVESRQMTIDKNYYTIVGYANLHGIKSINRDKAARLGRRAAKLSRKNGYEVGREYDAKYGTVHTYHTDILEMIFGEVMPYEVHTA